MQNTPQLATVPLGSGFLLYAEPDIHSLSRARRPSQKIEFVFSASPETIRREPRESDLRRSVGNRRTWQTARCVIPLFPYRRRLGSRTSVLFCRYEISFFPVHGEQIRHHLPSYGKGCSIGIALLLFGFIDQS